MSRERLLTQIPLWSGFLRVADLHSDKWSLSSHTKSFEVTFPDMLTTSDFTGRRQTEKKKLTHVGTGGRESALLQSKIYWVEPGLLQEAGDLGE